MIMECDLRSLKKVRSHSSKGEDAWMGQKPIKRSLIGI